MTTEELKDLGEKISRNEVSKEEILLAAFEHNPIIYYIALFTSGLTAFYMFRLYFSIFWNKPYSEHSKVHHGEGGWVMMLPLVLLAIGAATAGFIPFGKFVSSDGKLLELPFHLTASIAPVSFGLIGIGLAMLLYKTSNNKADKLSLSLNGIYKAAYNKLYIDELYLFITKKILFNLIGRPAAWIDKTLVDGMINQIGSITQNVSGGIKKIQSGKLQQYAIYFFTSILLMAFYFIYLWK